MAAFWTPWKKLQELPAAVKAAAPPATPCGAETSHGPGQQRLGGELGGELGGFHEGGSPVPFSSPSSSHSLI